MALEVQRPQQDTGRGVKAPQGYYEVKLPGTSAPPLRLKTRPNVFVPTDTSVLLIEACRVLIKQPATTLDLGCGCGITGLALAKLGLCSEPLYASDASASAVELTLENAKRLGIECVAKTGSLFDPWRGHTFDCIVDDISGISEELAAISPWFPKDVPCGAGRDGTHWIVQVLKEAAGYLNPTGVLIFPILSLSAEQRVLKAASEHFPRVEMLVERQWSLPESMSKNRPLTVKLMEEGTITCVRKFGTYLWWTKIFAAWNNV